MRLFSGFHFLALEKAGSPHKGSGQELSGVLNSPVSLTGAPQGSLQVPKLQWSSAHIQYAFS